MWYKVSEGNPKPIDIVTRYHEFIQRNANSVFEFEGKAEEIPVERIEITDAIEEKKGGDDD
eukprot:CAMPEP_0114577180 /NCGR_PEP_ID=MMETSP0125-20121206/1868_1 /TAXON_ID=485358 ORGANISM="Aristerostoma sp., Strain ATCC 50986" /NCGR_SAMPLE_ID=MMETSP0125 /ASSEMBLY_ACC=CAM_ASM_000245 /LENGTH=60 /DNA_ID=CAMNT_0001766289 /DNA_START=1292 /DNA_END=1474 /DNA_ORIENTATION=+